MTKEVSFCLICFQMYFTFQLLRASSGMCQFLSGSQATPQEKEAQEAKRVTFFESVSRILTRSKGSLNQLTLKLVMQSCTYDVLAIILTESFDETQTAILLCRMLTLLNVFPNQANEPRLLAEEMLAKIPSEFPFHGSVLYAGGSSVISPVAKSIIFERCIERMFESSAAMTWTEVKDRLLMEPSDFGVDELISACHANRCYLTLYAHALVRLSRCTSFKDEVAVSERILMWVTIFDPKIAAGADKILLFIPFLLSLTSSQLSKEPSIMELFTLAYNKMVEVTAKLMADRDSDGLLGFIGFGSKSPHPLKLRVVARVMNACFQAQVTEKDKQVLFNRRISPRMSGSPQASLCH